MAMDPVLYGNITNISYSFLIGGLIVVLLTVGNRSEGALNGTITGYATATCAILFMLGLVYYNHQGYILSMMIPLAVFIYSFVLIGIYFEQIAHNHVSGYYTTFSYISVALIFTQVNMLFTDKLYKETGTISQLTLSKMLLIATINILALISMGISLKYFSTDG
jgi:NADH:ubiquinone oxidoreductase subunit K